MTQRSQVDSGSAAESALGFGAQPGSVGGAAVVSRPAWQRLFVIGMSHRTAPIDVREGLALPEDEVRK
ncbi:MAG TPA: hypothetical protein PKI03_10450, partial [Pseudomonadota bacterium]|nr:hypothetical protein [Pseudomonadota bacterium]